ncbi:MAG TPA: hypothetical protein VEZ18_02345, partial [Geodermatophilus sp.]|nr:hypothetical protein [Geodermatophilus sp.]
MRERGEEGPRLGGHPGVEGEHGHIRGAQQAGHLVLVQVAREDDVLLDAVVTCDVLQALAHRISGTGVHGVALAAAGEDEPETGDHPANVGDRLDEAREALDRMEEAEEDGEACVRW